ncbi:MAG: hypothetical protein GY940_17945, partial [bacterium]|nr:hypothetical protein [bacterium]
TVFGVLGFFLALGTYLGTFKSKATGWSLLITSWFALVFLAPAAVNFYIAQKSKNITPLSRHEMDKLTVVMDFEKGAIKEGGKFSLKKTVTDADKKLVLGYFNNEFKKIHSKEDELRAEMASNISSYHWLSMWFPSTFYLSVVEEAGSRGYLNLLVYYAETQVLKKEFFKYYMDKVYFSEASDSSGVENFIKGDENIVRAEMRKPETYGWGHVLLLIYTVFICFLGYRGFLKMLVRLP